MTTARFKINDSPHADGGYAATFGEELVFELEDLPAPDVRQVTFTVVSKTKLAADLVVAPGVTPTAPQTSTMQADPGTYLVAYLVACQLNGGQKPGPNNTMITVPEWTSMRVIAVVSDGLRYMVPGEREQWEPGGWAHLFNLLAQRVLDGSAVVPANITNNVSITGPGIMTLDPTGALRLCRSVSNTLEIGQNSHRVAATFWASAFTVVSDQGIQAVTSGTTPIQLSSSQAFNAGATSNMRLGALATTTNIFIGVEDAGPGFFHPAAITIGGLPSSGTHAVNIRGRVTTIQAQTSLALSGPLVTIDGIRFDFDSVAKGNGTTLEAGRTNVLTGSGWTLPALSGVADGEVVRVVHSLSSGTISRAGSDTINAGSGHTTDTTWTLDAQQSVVFFQKIGSEWRAFYMRSATAGGGGGGSDRIDDGSGNGLQATGGNVVELGTVNSFAPTVGAFSPAALTDVQISAGENASLQGNDSATLRAGVGGQAKIELFGAGGVSIQGEGEIGVGTDGLATAIHVGSEDMEGPADLAGDTAEVNGVTKATVRGAAARLEIDASGGNGRVVWVGPDGNTARTDLFDDAACSTTYVVAYTETVGSASRAVTTSGANRTETYNGNHTLQAPGAAVTINDVTRIRCGSSGGDLISANNLNYVYVTDSQVYVYGGGTQRIQCNVTGIGFFGATPAAKPAALTAAVGGTINSGDATTDTEIANMRTRIAELETKLQSLGLLS